MSDINYNLTLAFRGKKIKRYKYQVQDKNGPKWYTAFSSNIEASHLIEDGVITIDSAKLTREWDKEKHEYIPAIEFLGTFDDDGTPCCIIINQIDAIQIE